MNTLREELRKQLAVAFNYGYTIGKLGGVNPGYVPNAELDAIIAAFQARRPEKTDGDEYADGWNDYADAVNEVLGGTE